jgi:hypothetical protein
MKRSTIGILLSFSLVTILALVYYSVPLRRPSFLIRSALLSQTPIGSTRGDVLMTINSVYSVNPLLNSSLDNISISPQDVVADLGSYSLPCQTSVIGIWKFDAEGILADLSIYKQ